MQVNRFQSENESIDEPKEVSITRIDNQSTWIFDNVFAVFHLKLCPQRWKEVNATGHVAKSSEGPAC